MTLFETLKQFKKIEPDPVLKETSKRAILAFEPKEAGGWSAQKTFLRVVESAVAVALAGFFILLISGAFSGSPLSPQYSAIDAQALRAEAQAIDIQIELANLNYSAPAAESTMMTAATGAKKPGAASPLSITQGTETSPSSTASTTVTIDQALQSLTQ